MGCASRTSGEEGGGDVSSGWRELLRLRHAVSDPWICVRGTFAAQKHDTMEYNDPSVVVVVVERTFEKET